MKKTTRKLELSTEALRLLTTNLKEVRGGMIKATGVSCDTDCTQACVTEASCAPCTHPSKYV